MSPAQQNRLGAEDFSVLSLQTEEITLSVICNTLPSLSDEIERMAVKTGTMPGSMTITAKFC